MKFEIANRTAPGSPPPESKGSRSEERKVLYLYIDSTRRHRLRELKGGATPSIDDWLDALQEASEKTKRRPSTNAAEPTSDSHGAHASTREVPPDQLPAAGYDPPPTTGVAGSFFFCACND